MKKYPTLYGLATITDVAKQGPKTQINGKWYPARPLGYQSLLYRFLCAWDVFRGYADAVVWPEDDEIVIGTHDD